MLLIKLRYLQFKHKTRGNISPDNEAKVFYQDRATLAGTVIIIIIILYKFKIKRWLVSPFCSQFVDRCCCG